jgi:regulator of sirC expression with transglutaminase-like and TPR domain
VSFPGHFLVRMPVDDGLVVLDPFLRGRSLDLDELRQLAKPHVGDAAHEDGVMSKLLAPASNRDILSRMLRNLKVVYLDRQDTERALRCSDRLIRLNPGSAIDYRARGEIYRQLGHASAAQADLRRCLELDAEIDEADTIRDQLVELAGKRTALN